MTVTGNDCLCCALNKSTSSGSWAQVGGVVDVLSVLYCIWYIGLFCLSCSWDVAHSALVSLVVLDSLPVVL